MKPAFYFSLKCYIKLITDYLFSKRTVFLLAGILYALIFRGLFKKTFDEWFVMPCLSLVNSSVLNDFIFIALLVLLIFTFWHYFRNKTLLHSDWIVASVFTLFIYTYCRIDHIYEMVSYHILPSIYYSDNLFILLIVILVIKGRGAWYSHEEPTYKESPFLVDVPITAANDDLLNRKKFAQRIAEKVQSKLTLNDAGALAIGIIGEWGSGKTSFSNMIVEAINLNNRIVIHFNPWRSSSAHKIIEDFFELLIAELKKYDATLSANIYSYAKTLTKIDKNLITKTLEALGDIFNETNKNEAYISINKSITAINKQIIIFIDDLDRLDKVEIIEVLRIIRNTANFNNVVYIVAYDKGYVLEAVKSFNEYNFQAFLEKIFQFEFTLPMYEPGIIRKYLKTLLKHGLSSNLENHIDAVVDSDLHKGINFTNEIIRTHREAIRLANGILFEINGLENDVFFYDFYLLQVLKLQYPFVYNGLITYRELFFLNDPKNKDNILRLRLEHERTLDNNSLNLMRAFSLSTDSNIPLDPEKREPIFYQFLEENKNKFAMTGQDIFLIKELISELLDADRQINEGYKNERYKAFYRAENFYKYFAFELREGEIPSIEFEKARMGDFDIYTEQVNKWIAEGKWQAFQDRLLKIEDFANKHEFENQVKALFESGKVYSKNENPYVFNFKYLIKILNYPIDIARGELRLYDDIEQYLEFLRRLLKVEGSDKRFEIRLLKMIIDQEQNFPLSFDELSEISLQYLEDYLNAEGVINDTFWTLLNDAHVRTEDGYRGMKNPIAKQLGSEYYLSHVKECELGRFIHQVRPESKYYELQKDVWTNYFQTIEEFREWFDSATQLDKSSECYKEFDAFFKEAAVNNFQGIVWEFTHIVPGRWE